MEDISSSQKKKQEKKTRDTGKPKRPLSAYNLFFRSEREKILLSVPERAEGKPRRSHGKIGFGPLARMIAERWNSIDLQERTLHDARAAQEKIRYFRELEEWRTKNSEKPNSSSSMFDDNEYGGTIQQDTDSSEEAKLPARRDVGNTSAEGLPSSTATAPQIPRIPSLLLPMVAARMPAGSTMLGAGDYTTLPPVVLAGPRRHSLLPNNLGIARPDGPSHAVPVSGKDSSSLQSIGTRSPHGMSANWSLIRADGILKLVYTLDEESMDFFIGLFRT